MIMIHILKESDTGHFLTRNWAIVFITLAWYCWAGCNSEKKAMNPEMTIAPGTFEVSMEVDTTTRWYTLVIPTGYDHVQKRPLVLAFHPGNANMAEFYNALKGFRDMAEAENWLMVFPNGRNTTDNRTGECLWNAVHCCGLAYTQNVDDVGFVRELIEKLQAEYRIDENRIYATGRSNGGMLVHRLGADLANTFAAIAPFSASVGGTNRDNPEQIVEPTQPLPILLMHGLNDHSVRYHGGVGGDSLRNDLSFRISTMVWVENNGCDSTVVDTTILESDKGRTWIATFQSCPQGADVVSITVENSGHQLPRVSNSGFDGSKAIFQFFQSHARNQ